MAIEKGKVVAKLLVKYKGKSLTKNFIEKLAERYAAKIETDDDATIDAYIEDRDDLIQETISEGDRRVTTAVQAATKKPTETVEEGNKEVVKLPDDTPEWAKALVGSVTKLSETVTSMQAKETAQTLKQRFESDPRLKGIDPKLLKGRVPQTEAELENAISEAAEDLKDFVKDEAQQQQKFGADKPNFSNKQNNGGGNGGVKPETKQAIADVKAFTDTLKQPAAKAAQAV